MIAWFRFFLFILLGFVIEFLWDAAIGKWIGPPNLTILVAVGVALNAGPRRGAVVGGLTGLLNDLVSIEPNGAETISGVLIGALAGFIGRRVLLDTDATRFTAVAILTALAALMVTLIDAALIMAIETSLIAKGYQIVTEAHAHYDYHGVFLAVMVWPFIANYVDNTQINDEEGLPTTAFRKSRQTIKR